jgi:threonine/homoserine/homoserine lactone efflux protein
MILSASFRTALRLLRRTEATSGRIEPSQRKSLRSIKAISAYLLVVTPLATVAAGFLSAYPMIAIAFKACSAAWILFLAIRLWLPQRENLASVSFRSVVVTTLLNPKAIIIGS